MEGFETYFPVWDKLTNAERALLTESVTFRSVPAGTVLHNGDADCVGMFLIRSGQLRAYVLSETGREVTLYRLLERDMCLFSGSCMLASIQFQITVSAEKDTGLWVIPVATYQKLMETSIPMANYTNELMAAHLSEVMWLVDQILFRSMDSRLASFLLSESGIEESEQLCITHEQIAGHLGTAREVVTRMLRYFQSEGMVRLSRGDVTLTDRKKLSALAG